MDRLMPRYARHRFTARACDACDARKETAQPVDGLSRKAEPNGTGAFIG
jgi:hypothetical protein